MSPSSLNPEFGLGGCFLETVVKYVMAWACPASTRKQAVYIPICSSSLTTNASASISIIFKIRRTPWTSLQLAPIPPFSLCFDCAAAPPPLFGTDGDRVPVPHTGLAMTVGQFHKFAERLRAHGVEFVVEPHLRFQVRLPLFHFPFVPQRVPCSACHFFSDPTL